MSWESVDTWLSDNAGQGASLIGSLLTGNVPAAVAAGVSLVSSATGSTDPKTALQTLQNDHTVVIKLKELAIKEEDSIRQHLSEMYRLELEDRQKNHEQTQLTVRNGDSSESGLIRAVRPTHATVSLIAAIAYVFSSESVDTTVLGALLTLPFTYFGLREVGKGIKNIIPVKSI